jgi:hypothetical protein
MDARADRGNSLVSSYLYIEGGGNSKELHARCREAFRRLLEACGFTRRMPRLVACGSRFATYEDFTRAHAGAGHETYVAMLVDSEHPVADINRTWEHLVRSDGWQRPATATDEQVLLMVTCMETWIVTDRDTLRAHYGSHLHESVLPPIVDMESRGRDQIQEGLALATRSCPNAYAKGKRSFQVVGRLNPETLTQHLPSFRRLREVLEKRLRPVAPAHES